MLKSLGTLFSISLAMLSFAPSAYAQAAYGSYIGVGPTIGLSSDGDGHGQQIGGSIAVRYKLLEVPLSLRVQGLIGSGTSIVPTVSYDIPIGWQTDIYLGAGMAFSSGKSPSPVGDKTSFVLQPGIDYMIPSSNLALYGNAIISFDAYEKGGGTAFSLQSGLGLKF